MRTLLVHSCLLWFSLVLTNYQALWAQDAEGAEETGAPTEENTTPSEKPEEAESPPDEADTTTQDQMDSSEVLPTDEDASEAMGNIEDDALLYPEEETLSNSPLSIQIAGGKKWYKDNPIFHADELNFAAEWYILEDFPLKLGPSLSYAKLTNLTDGYNSGQLLEASLRVSSFWDFGLLSPYLAIEYLIYSSGSLDYQKESSGLIEKATYDLTLSGYDLAVGVQIQAWDQNYIIIETSIANSESYKISGNLGRIDIDATTGEQSRQASDVSFSKTWKFQSLVMGILFEL